ncbi:MAG: DUF6156 family protein [Bacteroidota bacterium]
MTQNPSETVVRYYASWSGYSIPFKPKREISFEETKVLPTYYIAHFRGANLVQFQKYCDGELEWTDRYTYWPDRRHLQKRTMTKASGEQTIQQFDERGNLKE